MRKRPVSHGPNTCASARRASTRRRAPSSQAWSTDGNHDGVARALPAVIPDVLDSLRRSPKRRQRIAGPNARLLVTADAMQDHAALQHAYADDEGRTASLTKQVLAHLNRTRAATFDLDAFEHRALWNPVQSRIELRLVSRIAQEVRVGGERAQEQPMRLWLCEPRWRVAGV